MADKTFIPGAQQRLSRSRNSDPGAGSIYSPTPGSEKGTYIPGAMVQSDGPGGAARAGAYAERPGVIPVDSAVRNITLQPRVIAGVLYSISKGLLGEIFPVYLGSNTLGSDTVCEIRLQEGSVSPLHGYLQVTRDEVEGTFTAIFTDKGSINGSEINGADARFETLRLNDGDILGIGLHYRLLFKIFNSTSGRLYEDGDFQDTSVQSLPQMPEEEVPTNFNADLSNDFYAPSDRASDDGRTVLY